MKTVNPYLKLLLLFIIPFLFIYSGCGKSESPYQCETVKIQGETIKACCNDTDCYYDWDGEKYYCDGQDCEAAAERLAHDIVYGGGKAEPINSEIESAIVKRLLDANR